MSGIRSFLNRWNNDFEFKTFTASAFSLAVTVIFAFFNGFLGIYRASLWHGTICVYYLVLVILRGTVIAAAKRISRMEERNREQERYKSYLAAAILLLFLNACLIIPIALMVTQQKPVRLTLIPAITMAAYTTFRIIMASVNLKKRKRSPDCLVRLLRTISFIDALVAILTLQNTLIMVNSGGAAMEEMLPLTALTSGAVWLAAFLLSVSAIAKGIRHPKVLRGCFRRKKRFLCCRRFCCGRQPQFLV